MGTPRSRVPPTFLLAVLILLATGGCVAGSPLASFIAGDSSDVSPLASSPVVSPSPAAATPAGDLETPPPSRVPTVADSVIGHLTAGPTCPVESVPPNPSCAPRPLAAATVIATLPGGHEVARAVSSADGSYGLALAPGTYELTPQPMDGHMLRAPAGKSVTITGTATSPVILDFSYDTGIR